jgi:hypothetical protein
LSSCWFTRGRVVGDRPISVLQLRGRERLVATEVAADVGDRRGRDGRDRHRSRSAERDVDVDEPDAADRLRIAVHARDAHHLPGEAVELG